MYLSFRYLIERLDDSHVLSVKPRLPGHAGYTKLGDAAASLKVTAKSATMSDMHPSTAGLSLLYSLHQLDSNLYPRQLFHCIR